MIVSVTASTTQGKPLDKGELGKNMHNYISNKVCPS